MDDDLASQSRPTVVVLMAEHGPFLWNRSPDRARWDDYALDPVQLGVSPTLLVALTEWNDRYQLLALSPDVSWSSREEEQVWQREGLHLAYRLQHELGPDVEVRYHQDGDEQAVSERRGP